MVSPMDKNSIAAGVCAVLDNICSINLGITIYWVWGLGCAGHSAMSIGSTAEKSNTALPICRHRGQGRDSAGCELTVATGAVGV